jgi:hypothetical protein
MLAFAEIYIFDLLENLSLKIYSITYCLKIHENTCELNFLSWHYHSIMGPIQKHGGHVSNLKKHSP